MKVIWSLDLSRLTQRFLLVLLVVSPCACENRQPAKLDSGAGAIVGVNYTDNGIQWFTIDGASGVSLGTYSGGGGFVCCVSYPKMWTPDLKMALDGSALTDASLEGRD